MIEWLIAALRAEQLQANHPGWRVRPVCRRNGTGVEAIRDESRLVFADWKCIRGPGTPVTKWQACDALADTHIVLIGLGALVQAPRGLDPRAADPRQRRIRAALRTWPA